MIRKYLLVTTGFVLAVFLLILIASWVWLATLDLQAQRARIETFASQLLARDVHIDGPLKLNASLFPSVSVENVRIANPEWAAQPDFLAIKQLAVEINPWALLREKFEIRDVELTGVTTLSAARSGSGCDVEIQFRPKTGIFTGCDSRHSRNACQGYPDHLSPV